MVYKITSLLVLLFISFSSFSQTSYDSLKNQVIQLEIKVDQINLNLETSQRKFKNGILIATIGYTTTITGGLMLGRKNDDLGQALLVVGGTTGVIGTYKMVDAFRFLTGNRKRKRGN